MNVAVYITNHGFGHATRTLQVLNQLNVMRPDAEISIRTGVPKTFLDYYVRFPFNYTSLSEDMGVIDNGLTVDVEKTAAKLLELESVIPGVVSREVQALRSWQADLVYMDIPPFAGRVAAELGVPSLAVGNFSWDIIYRDCLPLHDQQVRHSIDRIEEDYRLVTLALQLPLGPEMTVFPNRRHAPLIARQSFADQVAVRGELGIGTKLPLILVALRPDTLAPVYTHLETQEAEFLIVGDRPRELPAQANCHWVPNTWQDRFTDLMVGSDIVLSKAGYGIVGECIANRRPLLHYPRHGFSEWNFLIDQMEESLHHQLIRDESADALGEALAMLQKNMGEALNPIPVNGAQVVAETIIEMAEGRV